MFDEVLFHSDAFTYFDTDANPISCVVATTNGHSAERAQAALADEYGLPESEFAHVGTVEAGDPETADMVEHPDHASVWYHNAGVEALQPSRSTRPGDLIARVVAGGDVEGWYRVDAVGFTEIKHPQVITSPEGAQRAS